MKKEDVANELEGLEGRLGHSIGRVTNSLNNQVDLSQVRQMAMDKVRREEEAERQRVAEENKRLAIDCEKLSAKKKRSQPLPPIAVNMNTNSVAAKAVNVL